MRKLFLFAFAIALLSSSCSVMKNSTAKTLDIQGAVVVTTPVVADLNVAEKKVTGTAEGPSSSLQSIRQEAIANAIKSAGADVLVEPKYETQTMGSKVKVTVSGYPATYKNFRKMKEEDKKLIESGAATSTTVHKPLQSSNTNSKKKGGLIAGIISGVAVVGGLVTILLIEML